MSNIVFDKDIVYNYKQEPRFNLFWYDSESEYWKCDYVVKNSSEIKKYYQDYNKEYKT